MRRGSAAERREGVVSRPLRRAAVAAALAVAIAARAAGDDAGAEAGPGGEILRAMLPVEAAPGLAVDAPLRATIELNEAGVEKVASASDWYPRVRAEGGVIAVVLDGRAPAARVRPSPAHRRASFLVDFDRPEVAALRAEVVRRFGPAPSDEDLARFVDGWIEQKGMSELVDVASLVAARRVGDCSEHAVLLAAVARMFGRPARVVLGVALVPVGGALRGYGHAWAEIHDGRGWRTRDALAGVLPAGTRYLPLAALVDEGPGYTSGAIERLSPIDVRRIVLEPVTPRAGAGAPRAPRPAAPRPGSTPSRAART